MIKEEDWKARYHDPAVEKRRKKRRRRIRFRRFCTVLACLALIAGWFYWQQEGLSTETISVESAPDGFGGYRIAVISDLHGKEFGEGNDGGDSLRYRSLQSPRVLIQMAQNIPKYLSRSHS